MEESEKASQFLQGYSGVQKSNAHGEICKQIEYSKEAISVANDSVTLFLYHMNIIYSTKCFINF